MSDQATMDLIKFVAENSLIKEDSVDSQITSPVCLAILARMSMKNSRISFSKDRINSIWKSFEIDVPPATDSRRLTGQPPRRRDTLSLLVEDIVDKLTEFFLDKEPTIQSCNMVINPELKKCTVKINYYSRNE